MACELCSTQVVVLADGTALTEPEWQRRRAVDAKRPAQEPSVPERSAPERPVPQASVFRGAIEAMPVVDVLQFLCHARKSGLLRLTGPGGTTSIALSQGQIIGGANPERGRRIGQILVELDAITQEEVDAALATQRTASGPHRPLVSTLIAQGHLTEEAGWRGLKALIEELIVDVLGWESGSFDFEAGTVNPRDSFRHLPDGVLEGGGLDTQATLLEALRVMDERASGAKVSVDVIDLEAAFPAPPPAAEDVDEFVPTENTTVFALQRVTEPAESVPTRAQMLVHEARALLDRLPSSTKITLAAALGVVLLVLVLVLSTSGDKRVAPTPPQPTVPLDAARIETSEPAHTDMQAQPGSSEDSAVLSPAEPDVAPTQHETAKTAPRRKARKGKSPPAAKAKANGARSLFDAAVAPTE